VHRFIPPRPTCGLEPYQNLRPAGAARHPASEPHRHLVAWAPTFPVRRAFLAQGPVPDRTVVATPLAAGFHVPMSTTARLLVFCRCHHCASPLHPRPSSRQGGPSRRPRGRRPDYLAPSPHPCWRAHRWRPSWAQGWSVPSMARRRIFHQGCAVLTRSRLAAVGRSTVQPIHSSIGRGKAVNATDHIRWVRLRGGRGALTRGRHFTECNTRSGVDCVLPGARPLFRLRHRRGQVPAQPSPDRPPAPGGSRRVDSIGGAVHRGREYRCGVPHAVNPSR